MPRDLMTECQEKKQFLVGEKRVWRWVELPVARMFSEDPTKIRCAHCHGAVKVHRQKVEHGPQDHVEHKSREDSKGCKGGIYFEGEHRLSLVPVK